MNRLSRRLAVLLFALTALVSTSVFASEADRVTIKKATYEAADLQRNLGTSATIGTKDADQQVAFNVTITKDGEVDDIAYSTTIKDVDADDLQAFVSKAFRAIMSTQFQPASKDGQTVSDTIRIVLVPSSL